MSRGLAVALLLVTGCGARTALDDSVATVADEQRCNERFANDGDWPQISVAATSNGFVLAGSYDEAIQFGAHTLTSKDRALFVVRLDASCDVVWARQFSVDAYLVDLAVTSDGGVVLAGESGSAGVDFGDGHQGGDRMTDVFVARLDPAGAVLWSRVVPGTHAGSIAHGRGAGVVLDAADGVVLTGSFDGTTDCGGGTLASSSGAAFVARFDGDGAHVWSTALAAVDGRTSGERIAIDRTGAIVFAGDLWGQLELAGTTLDSAPFPARAFIAKFDAAGQPIAARLLPAPPFEGASQVVEAMVPDPSNGAFLVAAAYNDGAVVDAKQVLHLDDVGEASWVTELPFFENGSMLSVLVADAAGGVWYVDSCHSWNCAFSDGVGEGEGLPNSDVVAARFDGSGAVAWSHRWGSKRGWDYGQAATIDGEGRLILGGVLSDTLDFGAGPIIVPDAGNFSDANDLFLVRLP